MSARECRKDDPTWPYPCSCDDCARQAAHSWIGYMDRVMDGTLSLDEAQTLSGASFGEGTKT